MLSLFRIENGTAQFGWGDTVTCATWHDIWLNEGFATYSATASDFAVTGMQTGPQPFLFFYDSQTFTATLLPSFPTEISCPGPLFPAALSTCRDRRASMVSVRN